MSQRLGRRRFLRMASRAAAALLTIPWVAWAQEEVRAIHQATRNTLRGAIGVRIRRALARKPGTFKPYDGAERIALPPAESQPARSIAEAIAAYRTAPGFDASELPFDRLARILEASNGVTGTAPSGRRLRAALSAGALYAGEVYVVAERISGLAPGLYYYAPLTGDLALLREGTQLGALAASLAEPARAQGVAAAVLLTNVFARYRYRYANRGYRYALIDSGHIGENLRLAATSSGTAEWMPLRFVDDRLNELLGIDGLREAVCAVHCIGAAGTPKVARTQDLVEAETFPARANDAPERFHARTRLVPGRPPPLATEQDVATSPDVDAAGPALQLASRTDPGTPVEHAIRTRRSTRAYTADPIAAADLAFVLDAATGHEALQRTPGVELRVFLHRGVRADGRATEPGLYRPGPAPGELTLVRRGDVAKPLAEACLGQAKAGEAACGIAMVGRLEEAARRRGERSYRDLCIECGAIGQRIYLAAESLGLSARNLAAFVDERLNALAEVDGRERAVLHLTMVGPGD